MIRVNEAANFEELLREQSEVQARKFQGRVADEYEALLFPGLNRQQPRRSAVTDFVAERIGSSSSITLTGILEALTPSHADGKLRWADMGGGRALPMRQLAVDPVIATRTKMINVDLFDYGLDGLSAEELDALEHITLGATHKSVAPDFIRDNVETVQLPEPADLITSVETVQYLNDPLQALSNWYNQLADDGLLFVTADHYWPSWIRYQETDGKNRLTISSPISDVLAQLEAAGICYAVTGECDWPNGHRPETASDDFRILALQKKAETNLRLTASVVAVEAYETDYKATYYRAANGSGGAANAIVEVVS